MSQFDPVASSRLGYRIAGTGALISFALACLAWRIGGKPQWPGILLPFLILTNCIAGLEMGPFRSDRVRIWYYRVSIAIAVCLTTAIVLELVAVMGRLRPTP